MSCRKCNNKCTMCQKTTHRTEEEKKDLNKRLNIIEGQVRGIKQMILLRCVNSIISNKQCNRKYRKCYFNKSYRKLCSL